MIFFYLPSINVKADVINVVNFVKFYFVEKCASSFNLLFTFCNFQSQSCIKKAAQLALVKIKTLPTDENFSLRGETLSAAIKEAKRKGLIPCFVRISPFSP